MSVSRLMAYPFIEQCVVSGMSQAPNWKGKVHISNGPMCFTYCGKSFDPTMPADEREVAEWGYCARCLSKWQKEKQDETI